MISYPVNWRELRRKILHRIPTWFVVAQRLTDDNRAASAFVAQQVSHWRTIKYELQAIQYGKCAWCERRIEGVYEADVDHVRPKHTYFLLAYQLENYVVSCKSCNSGLKSTTFPLLSGTAFTSSTDVEAVERSERAVLPTPLYGGFGTRPESLITFDGILAVPASSDHDLRDRARRTIAVLGLNSREVLWRERAHAITTVWSAWIEHEKASAASGPVADLRGAVSGSCSHSGCRRAFLKACLRDRERAARLAELSTRVVRSTGALYVDATHYRV